MCSIRGFANRHRGQAGSSLITVIFLIALVGVAAGMISMRAVNQNMMAQKSAQKSDMRRIVAYYAKLMRGTQAFNYNVAGNSDIHSYVIQKAGAVPNSCPRIEQCNSAAPARCPAGSTRPACDPPSAQVPMDAYDALGRIVIPEAGKYLTATFEDGTAANHRWKLNAYWSRQSGYRIHYHLKLTRNATGGGQVPPGLSEITMEVPSKHCMKHRGEKFRKDWGIPIFDNTWHGTEYFCPNGYTVLGGWAFLHPRNYHGNILYTDPWVPDRINVGFVNDAVRSDIRIPLSNHAQNPSAADFDFAVINCCWAEDSFDFK